MTTKRRLYVVDDEAVVRASIVSLVQAHGDFECHEYPSGDAFLAALDSLAPGCAVLDLQLEGSANGQAVMEALAGLPAFRMIVVTGFGAAQVDREVEESEREGIGSPAVRTLFNPEYDTADNLVSCLAAREEMDGDFLLLNGDTLVEPEIPRRLLRSARVAVSSAVVRKDSYWKIVE